MLQYNILVVSSRLEHKKKRKNKMTQYAVIHVEKGKGSGGALGNHIDRTEGKEYSFQNADPSFKHLNQNFEMNQYSSMPLSTAISERIKNGYTSSRKINDNAVTHLKIVLTGSHEKMKEIEKSPEALKSWVLENKKFLEERYGKENIVRFTIHRDEKTPHLHAVVVPLTPDGRLSAFEVMGNKSKLKDLQNTYAEKMKPFGLERGIENTGIKHENATAYYSRIEKSEREANREHLKASKNVLGIYTSESVDKLEKSLKEAKSVIVSKNSIIDSQEKKIGQILSRNESTSKANDILKKNIQMVFGNEKTYKIEQSKVLEKAKNELIKGFEIKMKYDFPKMNSNQDKSEYIFKQLEKISEEKEIVNLIPSVIKDESFREEIEKKFDERALKNEQSNQRGFSR